MAANAERGQKLELVKSVSVRRWRRLVFALAILLDLTGFADTLRLGPARFNRSALLVPSLLESC
jgi:hypothetical protein